MQSKPMRHLSYNDTLNSEEYTTHTYVSTIIKLKMKNLNAENYLQKIFFPPSSKSLFPSKYAWNVKTLLFL